MILEPRPNNILEVLPHIVSLLILAPSVLPSLPPWKDLQVSTNKSCHDYLGLFLTVHIWGSWEAKIERIKELLQVFQITAGQIW